MEESDERFVLRLRNLWESFRRMVALHYFESSIYSNDEEAFLPQDDWKPGHLEDPTLGRDCFHFMVILTAVKGTYKSTVGLSFDRVGCASVARKTPIDTSGL